MTYHCPECGSAQPESPRVAVPDIQEYDGLYECQVCHVISLQPYPCSEIVASWYETTGNWQLLSAKEWQLPTSRRVGWINELCAGNKGRVLEIGACRGDFLQAMVRIGWDVEGIEPAANDVQTAYEQFGLKLRHEFFDENSLGEENFDVVVCWDVLEHFRYPQRVLRAMASHLKPGGVIVFSIPHIDGVPAKLLGSRWRYRMSPKHLHFFPLSWLYEQKTRIECEMVEIKGFAKVHAWGEALLPPTIKQVMKRNMPVSTSPSTAGASSLSQAMKSKLRKSIRTGVLRLNQTPVPLKVADLIEVAMRKLS